MNYILFQKQEPVCINTKSINQCPIIKAQTSDKIQSKENSINENKTVVFDDDMLLSKQANIFDLFSTRERHNNFDVFFISQTYFHLPKNTIRNISNIIIF